MYKEFKHINTRLNSVLKTVGYESRPATAVDGTEQRERHNQLHPQHIFSCTNKTVHILGLSPALRPCEILCLMSGLATKSHIKGPCEYLSSSNACVCVPDGRDSKVTQACLCVCFCLFSTLVCSCFSI